MVSETFVGILMGACSLCGFLINWLIVLWIIKYQKMKNPFSILTVGLASVDGIFSTLYLFYATPMVLFDIQILSKYSSICGYLLMICYDMSTSFHFFISLNRFLAVFKPILYHKVFSTDFTKCILLLVFLLSFSLITLFFQILGCTNYYNMELRAFRYSDEEVCKFYGFYGDFCQVFSLTVISALMDVLAIGKVISIGNKANRSLKEHHLLKQSISQTTFVLVIVISFTWGPKVIQSMEYAFVFSSILWCSVHCFDGIFTLYFNCRVPKSTLPAPSVVLSVKK